MASLAASYIQRQTLAGLARSFAQVYWRGFASMVAIFGLGAMAGVLAVLLVWSPMALVDAPHPVMKGVGVVVSVGLYYSMLFVTMGALTIAVSELARGNRPNAMRAMKRVLETDCIVRLLWTSLLQMLAVGIGFLLLVVPGVVLMAHFALVPAVVALEPVSGWGAMKRSHELCRGHLWRITGQFLLLIFCTVLLVGLVFLVASQMSDLVAGFAVLGVEMLAFFASPIFLVLIYYDLRVRKEGYDLSLLDEELRE